MGHFISKIKLDAVRYSPRIQVFRHYAKYKICATLIPCKSSQTSPPGPHVHQHGLQSHFSVHKRVLEIRTQPLLTLPLMNTDGFQLCWELIRHTVCLKRNKTITTSLVIDQLMYLGL